MWASLAIRERRDCNSLASPPRVARGLLLGRRALPNSAGGAIVSLRRICWPALAVAATLAGCARNPATGGRQLMLVDERREIAMGREADRQVTARLGIVDDPRLQACVTRVGRRLVAYCERPELPWRFRIVDDGSINAFALPGGFLYVTRGLLAHLDSEAELAAVLGHEIGHVTGRHSTSRTSQAQLAAAGIGLGALFEPRLVRHLDLASAGIGLVMLELGRCDEREADRLGLRYVERAGYSTQAVLRVLTMLGRVETRQEANGPQWRSSHPLARDRVSRMRALAGAGGREDRLAYLRAIDGLPFGDAPRSRPRRHLPLLPIASSCFGPSVSAAAAAGSRDSAAASSRVPGLLQVLDAGPLRLDEVSSLYPSVVSSGTVALLNGLDPETGDAVVPQPMKRVVPARE